LPDSPGGVTCRASSGYARSNHFFMAEGAKGRIRLDPAYAHRGINLTSSRGTIRHPEVPQQSLKMGNFAS
jgi:hypothetical protein